MNRMKKVEEYTTSDLLELTLQLHSRALNQPNNKEMHDAYIEARQELEKRLPANENVVLPLVSDSLLCPNCKTELKLEIKEMTNTEILKRVQ